MHETPKTVPDSPPADLTAEAGQSAAYETANSFPRTAAETNPAFGPPGRPDEIGSLGPYRVIKELGRGGMGAVYLGFDERLKRRVALKVMLPQYAASATSKNRFLREARAAAQIAHDHIVTIHEADERDGTPYMAMQLLQGHPLDEYIKLKGRLDLAEVLRIGRETALGLAAAHGVGLVHRDIKPANLWMEAPTGRIKILDFGLAKPTQEEQQDTDLTATGAILGTPAFMAPEQALGEKADSRADLFSLGVVLYRIATGHSPFHGATVMAMLASVVAEEPTPVSDRNPAVPEPLAKLIHQLLAKKPHGRPKSATAVAEAIQQIELGTNAAVAIPLQPIPLDALPTMSNIVPGADPFAAIDATETDDVVHRSTVPRAKRGPLPKWPFVALAAMVAALAVLVPQIVKIATPKGTLVIETGDPDVEVVVKKGTATIFDKTKQREIVLSVGDDYQIDLVEPKDGLKLSTSKFEITKNGKTTVKVRVEKLAVAEKPKAATPVGAEPKPASFKNSLGMEFMVVPKGTAWLGGHDGIPGDRKFDLPQDIYVGRYEVTQEEWFAVTGENPSSFSRMGAFNQIVKDFREADLKRFPVEGVSWNDCQAFVEKLNKRDYEPGWIYRLPTENEWEYACRGGPMADKAESVYGYVFAKPTHDFLSEYANYGNGFLPRRTCKVGSYQPNKLGLHDMHGNVWEWCGEWGPPSAANPAGPLTVAYRGGSWNDDIYFHCSHRELNPPATLRGNGLGTRLVRARVATGPFLEIHGATSVALAEWVAKLPQGYCPDWIATRAGGTQVVFDAIANSAPGAKVPKLVTWSAKDRAEYDELKKSHRLVADAPYLLNDLYHSANVGIQDGREWETWYGTSEFVSTKIEDGLKFDRVHEGAKERWLPNSLSAIRQADGSITYSMVATWLPDRALEWRPALTEKELAATVAEYRKKGWRPHIVNPIYGNPEPTFLAVFLDNKANEAWDFSSDLTVADYEKELVARKAKGQRPRCVCSHAVGNKVGYSVVWDGIPASDKAK